MKVAPVYEALARSGRVEQRLIHTGQHYDADVNDVFFAELPLPEPHARLRVRSGSHGEQTARALVGLERLLVEWRPNLIVVPGDVNSSLAAALAAVKLGIPVCHLEAGLRSFDWDMPEEHNRRLTDHLSSLLLTHCDDANVNLAAEGISDELIALVGNTMIDSLFDNLAIAREAAAWADYGLERKGYILATLHRPGLVDAPDLLRATIETLELVARTIPVVIPLHPRTRSRLREFGVGPRKRLIALTPLPYRRFLSLEDGAAAVVTDSGGVQEETTALGVRCFTLRDNTERPVTITHGTNTLLGLEPERLAELPSLLETPAPTVRPPLWDGRAGVRAASVIQQALGVEMPPVDELPRVTAIALGPRSSARRRVARPLARQAAAD